jgi:hypothetical protein
MRQARQIAGGGWCTDADESNVFVRHVAGGD